MLIIKEIITHLNPHLDEIVAIWLLRKYGERIYKNTRYAKIIFWNTGGVTPDKRSAEEYKKEGKLLIGVGGGEFDEHPEKNEGRKEGFCAATLVAQKLTIANKPCLQKILKFTADNDLKGGGNAFDIAHLAQIMFLQNPQNPEKVIQWVIDGLNAKHTEQKKYHYEAKKEFRERGKIITATSSKNKSVKIAIINTDNELVNKWAREEENCSIVLQKNSLGHVQIFTNKKHGIRMDLVAIEIRKVEIQLKNLPIPLGLSGEGRVLGAEEWYFHEKLQALLNGALTAKDVIPTKIPIEKITQIIKENI